MTSPDRGSDRASRRWTRSTIYPDMWIDPDDDPRESGALVATDERGTLLEYLRRYRLTLQMKCSELDAEQLARRSVPPSTMSLLGLVRHLAKVEHWFRLQMAGQDAPRLYVAEHPGTQALTTDPHRRVVAGIRAGGVAIERC